MNFSNILLKWYALNKRELPWRDTNNPYFIWISEIILQQTRVEQGTPYYLRFIKAFPTVTDLANASEDKVLKLWQGLGYYSRARNLHLSAKYIQEHYHGIFPNTHKDILKLKGVGVYTAAAISSFSFGLPYAVVDGNVIRVLSRIFGIETPFNTALGRRKYQLLAQDLLDRNKPADNNQAIMEFGALQCVPKSPECSACPFIADCVAYSTNSVEKLPPKVKNNSIKKRFLSYLVLRDKDLILLSKRNSGIWNGLYEFPFLEYSRRKSVKKIISSDKWGVFFRNIDYEIDSVSHEFIHKLSHQNIYAKFWIIDIKRYDKFQLEEQMFVRNSEFEDYPVSRLTDKFMKQYNII